MRMSSRGVKPIFCGNLDYDSRQSDIERLFGKYGNVQRVDLKSGEFFPYCCFTTWMLVLEIILKLYGVF